MTAAGRGRAVAWACLAAVGVVGACSDPTAPPAPCTIERATEVVTIGYTIRANGDTVGPVQAWTCDPRIHLRPPAP